MASEIADKVLGKKTDNFTKNDKYLTADCVWQVYKTGCGNSRVNGLMAAEMLSPEGKKKARRGIKKITDKDFVFERQ